MMERDELFFYRGWLLRLAGNPENREARQLLAEVEEKLDDDGNLVDESLAEHLRECRRIDARLHPGQKSFEEEGVEWSVEHGGPPSAGWWSESRGHRR